MTRRRSVSLGLAMLLASVTLGAGFLMKDLCATHQWANGYQYRTSCYNDIYSLYFFRGLARGAFPYVDGDGTLQGEEYGDLEYPVGTGLFVGAVAKIVRTPPGAGEDPGANDAIDARQFFRVTSAGLGLAALLTVLILWVMARDKARILMIAAAPSVILYSFHNWDFLAVAMMSAGLFAYSRRHDGVAGALIGLGAATKLFPGILLPVLVLARWRQRAGGARARVPWGMIATAAAGFLVVNLPILALNAKGWLLPWRFQSTRLPNFETSWYGLCEALGGCNGSSVKLGFWAESYPELTGVLSAGLFAAAALLLLWLEWRRPVFRPYVTCFGVMILFLLTGKVFSPQFALWLLPFFVLVRLPWHAFAAFAISEAAVWISVSAWFLSVDGLPGLPFVGGSVVGNTDVRYLVMFVTVIVRYLVLAWMLLLTRRADENVTEAPHPADAAASVEFAT